ncbi:glycosyltransferase family 4 protein [Crenothrix sp.]|uniref:glycosyltransferase family 4 protein n=1 Tax=Crenothrix sp. TaxID=3100433 RepID=UPI00374D96C5
MESIAIVVPELLPVPPVQGGAVEHWVDEASIRLVAKNRKLAVISRPAGIAGHNDIEYIGIPWTPIERFFHRLKEQVTWKNPLRYIAKIQNVYSYGQRVAAIVRNFDVVYLHNEPNILLFLQKRTGQKIVLHMHNDHLSTYLFRPFYRRALAKADTVLCVSDYIRRQAVTHFPEYAARFQVLFNSTDPQVFKPYGEEALRQLNGVVHLDSNKRYLLYVGRLTPVKGVHILIEAFRSIHQQMPDVQLIITGSSFFGGAAKTAYEQELVTLAEPVNEAIIFTGFLPHEKLKYLYSAVDLIVLPSTWQDPCPLVVLEAMASGTCLISSAVGGIPEILETGKNGILVEPGDVSALANAVFSTLNAPEMMTKMENTARQKIIAGYTWERLVSELEPILSDSQSA